MKKFFWYFLTVMLFFPSMTNARKKYSPEELIRDFPQPSRPEIFKNLWFYDTMYGVDSPRLELKLRPDSIAFKGMQPKKCELLQNLDTRVVYRCLHGDLSYGDYYTYHLFVSAGKDFDGRCLVLGDTQTDPSKLDPGKKPVVYYFEADDCGVYEDLTDYLIRF